MKVINTKIRTTRDDVVNSLAPQPPAGRQYKCEACSAILEIGENEANIKAGWRLNLLCWKGIEFGWFINCPECNYEVFLKAQKNDYHEEKDIKKDGIVNKLPKQPPAGRQYKCWNCGVKQKAGNWNIYRSAWRYKFLSWHSIQFGWYATCPNCKSEQFLRAEEQDIR